MKGAILCLRNDMDAGLGAFRAAALGSASLLEEKPTPSALVFPAKFLKLEVQMSVRQLILDMGKN